MAVANLNGEVLEINSNNDSIIIVKDNGDVAGGRTLDLSAWDENTVAGGHVIIKTSAGEYAPLGVSEGSYVSIPTGASVIGILKVTVTKANPQAAILVAGVVNEAALPYALTATIKSKMTAIAFINK